MKLKVGDQVVILQGKDKGKKGKIERVLRSENKILVAGVNVYKKHVRRERNSPAGIIEVVKPISAAKVSLICPKCNLPTRLGFVISDSKKARICKKCKQEI